MLPQLTSDIIRGLAIESGFDLCVVTSPDEITGASTSFENWLERGLHGEMEYMSHNPERRCRPGKVMPSVRSIIMLGLNYYQKNSEIDSNSHGRISRYARGRDYHKVMERIAKRLISRIETACDELTSKPEFRFYVDYGPLLERAYAAKGGMGYIGKNGMLISRQFGSWLFLAGIMTDLYLEPDNPAKINHGRCGKCRLCIDACPTSAIIADGIIDSRLCISYLTIEKPKKLPSELSSKISNLLFGCDICQEVCPHNGRAVITSNNELLPQSGVGESLDINQLLDMKTNDEFLRLTAGTPLTRAKLEGLNVNASRVKENLK